MKNEDHKITYLVWIVIFHFKSSLQKTTPYLKTESMGSLGRKTIEVLSLIQVETWWNHLHDSVFQSSVHTKPHVLNICVKWMVPTVVVVVQTTMMISMMTWMIVIAVSSVILWSRQSFLEVKISLFNNVVRMFLFHIVVRAAECEMKDWSMWSTCSSAASCGPGIQKSYRNYVNEAKAIDLGCNRQRTRERHCDVPCR